MLVQKHLFYTPKLNLDIGDSIPVVIGYETYGRLNATRNNAVLICHYLSGTSHAAGRYHPEDAAPGWWDALIGPGKSIDTDQYFVVCVDTLCNLNVKNPLVTTTGPAAMNPATGLPYGADFPQITIRDNVRLQRQLLISLGVERLACVAGPSMGGFQALEWAVTFPDLVGRVIAAVSSPQCPATFGLGACQAGIDTIVADPAYRGGEYYGTAGPEAGLTRAAFLLSTLGRTNAWAEANWGRRTAVGSAHPWASRDGRFAFQAEVEQNSRERAQLYDANHFIYTARGCILHDIGHGNGGLEGAARKIAARVLMLPISSDLLFPPDLSQNLVNLIRQHGGTADMTVIQSPNGHLAGVFESSRFAEPISQFLSRNGLH